jgi:hypothetical protein
VNINNDHVFDVTTAPKRDSLHWEDSQVTWAELIDWMEHPARTKACGNYVLGKFQKTTARHPVRPPAEPVDCTDLHRTKRAIVSRGALTLDVDHPEPDFKERVQQLTHALIIHTTYSSTVEEPRYRLIVPLSRDVTPDEYHAAAGALMQQLGVESFDPGSVQPERYMFRPSESSSNLFWYDVQAGPLADVERLLEDFQPDLSILPLPKPNRSKRNPFEIDGTIGYFNQAYENLDELIAEYDLPYEQSSEGRYALVGATAAAGMGEVTPGLFFSHHANDPAYGQTCSAFDLVRLHLFGDLDEKAKPATPINKLPSTLAMLDLASGDQKVQAMVWSSTGFDVVADEVEAAIADDGSGPTPTVVSDWRMGFSTNNRTGFPTDDIHNWDLIAKHDPVIQGLYYDELSLCLRTDRDLPWRTMGAKPGFDKADESALANHIERSYRLKASDQTITRMLAEGPRNRYVNPVVDYLNSLTWDGTARVEECLPGVVPTDYTRMVARKSMTAAAARMLQPGVKWDHMLMIVGTEGLGKSRWIEMVAKGYSTNLGPIKDTSTLQNMQGNWIITSDEGHSMRKADFDALKEFITRTHDKFRMPYDRESVDYPRRCVIWGTTNDPAFMKKQEGNRRFLPVVATQPVDDNLLTEEYVDQLWAEAVHLYRAGEPLWLNKEENALAGEVREDHMEDDPLPGEVEAFLNRELPSNWNDLGRMDQQMWLESPDNVINASLELVQLDVVCTAMVWDGLGNRNKARPGETRPLVKVLDETPGWVKLPKQVTVGKHGKQTAWKRIPTEDFDLI